MEGISGSLCCYIHWAVIQGNLFELDANGSGFFILMGLDGKAWPIQGNLFELDANGSVFFILMGLDGKAWPWFKPGTLQSWVRSLSQNVYLREVYLIVPTLALPLVKKRELKVTSVEMWVNFRNTWWGFS